MEIDFIHTERSHTNASLKVDGKYQNIAAASILAKTYRDDYMRKIDYEFPQYGGIKIKDIQQLIIEKQLRNTGLQNITEIHLSF